MGKVTKGYVKDNGEWVTTETTVAPEGETVQEAGRPAKGYRIVESPSLSALERGLTDCIADGWKPLGGIQIIRTGQDQLRYYQAIIKE